MSTLLDEPTTAQSTSPSQRLRTSTAAVRLSFTWFGVRKSLTTKQRAQAAESFGAEGNCLSAAKRLLDTGHPTFKAVAAVKNRATCFGKSLSLPYPEPGIRLIRQNQVEPFDEQLNWFQQELADAVDALDERSIPTIRSPNKFLGDILLHWPGMRSALATFFCNCKNKESRSCDFRRRIFAFE